MGISVQNYIENTGPSLPEFAEPIFKSFVPLLKRVVHEDQINDFLKRHENKDAFGFVEAVVDHMNIEIIVNRKELARIPSCGRVVIICNHPLGALDALALIDLIGEVRKDIKIVANDFLCVFENIKELLIPIESREGKISKSSLKAVYEALNNEEALIIFPSGEVSRMRPGGIADTKWRSGFYKIAQKSASAILPIYIDAKNSKSFYLLSMINKRLSSLTLAHEMIKSENKKIGFKIGRQIPHESYFIPSLSQKESVKLLRKHFYRLAKGRKPIFKTINEIALPESRSVLKEALKAGEDLGCTPDGKRIILYISDKIDAVLREIGRLREISFRDVGEGSGKKRDLDRYDLYYSHLVIWDDETLEIAGAYRIADCTKILEKSGTDALYTSTLFDFDRRFESIMHEGIELGRSFVQPRYRNSRALEYLWQGIGAFVRKRASVRYLFGPVSLSPTYSKEAMAMIVEFYSYYFGVKDRLVKHKEPYVLPSADSGYRSILTKRGYHEDMKILKEELALRGYCVPTLYKQYTQICDEGGVKFMDFGLDTEFGGCLDGFIVVDLHRLKRTKKERYIGV